MTKKTIEVNRASGALVSKIPRKHKSLQWFLASLLIIFVGAELICRYAIGLGDPPLYIADASIEYMLRPSRSYTRFHSRFTVNRYSMRADEFPPQKSTSDELRVLVIGDSVVYGGVRIDQSDIDTEILKRNLQQEYRRPVIVGNASAKSWGPVNELEYLKRFGALDADVVILELSSHDYADAPVHLAVVGRAVDYREKRPLLALTDLLTTYVLPRYLGIGKTPVGVDKSKSTYVPTEQDIAQCRDAERAVFSFARANHAKVALVQHLTLLELTGTYQPGYYANQAVAKQENVPYVDDAEPLRGLLQSGANPFYQGDPLHLNRQGQPILARTLQRAVELALQQN